MKKWLLFISIYSLLFSGCGAFKGKPFRDLKEEIENKSEIAAEQPQASSHSTGSASNLKPWFSSASQDTIDTPDSLPSPSSRFVPSSVSSLQPEPAPKPSLPVTKPKDKASPKIKSKNGSETSKKPSVPVHRSQGKSQSALKSHSLAELARKYPDILKLGGSTKEKKVALTFDDGPDFRFTPKVLDVLKVNNIKATFFLIGSKAAVHPELVRRMVREGHIIGNHSYSHPNFPKLNLENFESQIESTELVLKDLAGYAPKLIRPPYGAISENQLKWVSDHHYLIVNWNVDSLDWKQISADKVLQTVMQQTRPGSIILQHSGGGDKQDLSGSVQALPALIHQLQANGYRLVTVPELLHVSKYR
jgi:peptidoglycan/xylan/chitin deacetylase (PgdA/CDA1 family)